MNGFESLTPNQRQAAEIIVKNAVDRRVDKKIKKLTQSEIGEMLDDPVSDRTIRNWNKDPLFLAYIEALSLHRVRRAMPDFVGVLVANLEHGQNLSTKQLELIAKIGQWLPEENSSASSQLGVSVGHKDIEARIKQLEEKSKQEDVGTIIRVKDGGAD
ncbi:hypothetical protein [Nosocomiicoccus ampullae]|uniref:hypothetical protein n=1 Tax=Nosocomiicoccus ampullae TaxID=489910 RepID=UPI001C602DDB|nr:hypothetical protein [Nosocomiicoccus ampullae]QYA47963.1 hypothetical protein KPF52_05770 [Nosocomiicoccus ampullae]